MVVIGSPIAPFYDTTSENLKNCHDIFDYFEGMKPKIDNIWEVKAKYVSFDTIISYNVPLMNKLPIVKF